jgi:hypothetical protein
MDCASLWSKSMPDPRHLCSAAKKFDDLERLEPRSQATGGGADHHHDTPSSAPVSSHEIFY